VQVGLLRERVQEAKEQAGKMVYDPTLDLAAAAAEVYNFKDIRAVRMRQVKAPSDWQDFIRAIRQADVHS